VVVLPEPVGPGYQDQTAGVVEQRQQHVVVALQQAQLLEVQQVGGAVQKTQREVLAIHGRQGVDAQVDHVT